MGSRRGQSHISAHLSVSKGMVIQNFSIYVRNCRRTRNEFSRADQCAGFGVFSRFAGAPRSEALVSRWSLWAKRLRQIHHFTRHNHDSVVCVVLGVSHGLIANVRCSSIRCISYEHSIKYQSKRRFQRRNLARTTDPGRIADTINGLYFSRVRSKHPGEGCLPGA